jgi:hypothetical protein
VKVTLERSTYTISVQVPKNYLLAMATLIMPAIGTDERQTPTKE